MSTSMFTTLWSDALPTFAGIAGSMAIIGTCASASPLEAEARWLTAISEESGFDTGVHANGFNPSPELVRIGCSVSLPPGRKCVAPTTSCMKPATGYVVAPIRSADVRPASSVTIDCAQLARYTTAHRSAVLQQLALVLDGCPVAVGCTVDVPWADEIWTVEVTRMFPTVTPYSMISKGTRISYEVDVQAQTASAVRSSLTPSPSSPRPATAAATAPRTPGQPVGSGVLSPWKSPVPAAGSSSPALSSPLSRKAPASAALSPWKSPLETTTSTPSRGTASTPLPVVALDIPTPPTIPAGAAVKPASRTAVAGLETPLRSLREVVILPLAQPDLLAGLGLQPPRGILLHGPPGVGKTLLVKTIANEAAALLQLRQQQSLPSGVNNSAASSVKVFSVNGPEVLSPVPGESESRLRDVFAAATKQAVIAGVAIVFLDEMDALCPKRSVAGGRVDAAGTTSPAVARVVTQLLTLMDGVPSPSQPRQAASDSSSSSSDNDNSAAQPRVIVIGATNRPDALDPALRRPGRFEREVRIDPPDVAARLAILRLHSAGWPMSTAAAECLPSIAERCVGYVGADLQSLCREAAKAAMEREKSLIVPAMDTRTSASEVDGASGIISDTASVQPADFETAMLRTTASALRGVTASHPTTRWDEIGGMKDVVSRLREAVEFPLTHGSVYRRMGLSVPRGVLLHGPPGCSKTTLVRALASAVSASFFALSGADVFSPYVGDAEKAIRTLFSRARESVPSIVFLDEVDAMVGKRGIGGGAASGNDASTGVLATLLTEMDGVLSADGVLVVAATNRPNALDPALLRPGRLEVHIEVPLPDAAGRAEILAVHTRNARLAPDVDLAVIAGQTDSWSGAQLENLCREAAMEALRENMGAEMVCGRHFDRALTALR